MKKWVCALLTVIMAASLLCVGAFADEAEEIPDILLIQGAPLDASCFEAGDTVSNDAAINGILFEAGNDVTANGSSEYVIAAGNQFVMPGYTGKDALVAGRIINITGTVGRDAYFAAQDIIIDGTVSRNLFAAGKTVTVKGTVNGDLFLMADTVVIADDAVIGGQLHYDSNTTVIAPAGLLQNADVSIVDHPAQNDDFEIGISHKNDIGSTVLHKGMKFLGVVAVAMVLLWLTPLWNKLDREYYGAPFGKYARAFGIGWGVLAGVPLVTILLMITGIGLRLGFILLLAYAAVILMAPVFISFFVGMLLWRGAFKKDARLWLEIIIGAAVWCICGLIPGVKVALALVTVPLGLGVMMILLCTGKKKAAPAPIRPADEEPTV